MIKIIRREYADPNVTTTFHVMHDDQEIFKTQELTKATSFIQRYKKFDNKQTRETEIPVK